MIFHFFLFFLSISSPYVHSFICGFQPKEGFVVRYRIHRFIAVPSTQIWSSYIISCFLPSINQHISCFLWNNFQLQNLSSMLLCRNFLLQWVKILYTLVHSCELFSCRCAVNSWTCEKCPQHWSTKGWFSTTVSWQVLIRQKMTVLDYILDPWRQWFKESIQGLDWQCSREQKCADTIGTVLVPWAGHFQC